MNITALSPTRAAIATALTANNHESQQWIERQLKKRVPAEYFMVTFTLPTEFRSLAWNHQRILYSLIFRNYLPPPYTIFGKGEENSSRNEVKTFWLRLRKVEMAAWIRA